MGTKAFERINTILKTGNSPEKDTVVASPEITPANVGQFYDPNSEF
jgi:hypothetical protein